MINASRRWHYPLMLASGGIATLGFAPFNLPAFTLLSIASAYLLLQQRISAFWAGWCFGIGFFTAGVSWVYVSIHYHGNTPVLPALFLTLLFTTALGLLFALQFWLFKRFQIGLSLTRFAALWLSFEWLRVWFLTGFPWLYVGTAWIDTPLKTLFPVGGVWLVSLTVVTLACLIAESLIRRRALLTFIALMLFLVPGFLPSDWTARTGDPIKLALVQANIDQSTKWQPDYFEQHLDTLIQLTRNIPTEVDWVIWPETAIPKLIHQALPSLASLIDELDRKNQELISGFPMSRYDPEAGQERYYNALGRLTGIPQIYLKQRLVPFGEYLPLERQLRGLIEFFNLPMSQFSLPEQAQPLLAVDDTHLASAICYEIAYPELVSEQAKQAGLILTVSNDTWFTGSHGPDQHLQIARVRAAENGRPVIRSTNNGLTAVIGSQGEILQIAPREIETLLLAQVQARTGTTPFQRWGIIPAATLTLLLFMVGLVVGCRRSSFKETSTTG